MDDNDLTFFAPHFRSIEFSKRDNVGGLNQPLSLIIFPNVGVATVIINDGQKQVPIQMVGMEGLLGLEAVLGARQSFFTIRFDTSGNGFGIPVDIFMARLEASPALYDHIFRYVRFSQIQSSILACMSGRPMKQRIAAILLMLSDRLRTLSFPVTHQEMAARLNVQRPGATMVFQELEGMGLIRATRGLVKIVDRDGLIKISDGAYGQAEDAYERIFAWPLTDRVLA